MASPRPSPKRTKRAAAAAPDPAAAWRRVRLALRERGLLLMTDASLPCVAALVAGEPVRGSWWGHPAGRAIYAVCVQLVAHPDALACKLLEGKTTWLHRRLWPALMAVATAGDAWQTAGLSPAARTLQKRLAREGELASRGEAARELQARLLALGGEEHTAAGHHAVRLVAWEHWAKRDVLPPPAMAPSHGRLVLEETLRALGGEPAVARLPWRAAQRRTRRSQQAARTTKPAPPRRRATGA